MSFIFHGFGYFPSNFQTKCLPGQSWPFLTRQTQSQTFPVMRNCLAKYYFRFLRAPYLQVLRSDLSFNKEKQ